MAKDTATDLSVSNSVKVIKTTRTPYIHTSGIMLGEAYGGISVSVSTGDTLFATYHGNKRFQVGEKVLLAHNGKKYSVCSVPSNRSDQTRPSGMESNIPETTKETAATQSLYAGKVYICTLGELNGEVYSGEIMLYGVDGPKKSIKLKILENPGVTPSALPAGTNLFVTYSNGWKALRPMSLTAPAKVISGTGSDYIVWVYLNGLGSSPLEVPCKQLSILGTETIPPNTWTFATKAGPDWYMQVPVWI